MDKEFLFKPTFILTKGMTPFVFVVPPLNLNITCNQITNSINIIDFGEKVNFGSKIADRITFDTFLPALTSNFFNFKNPLSPSAALEVLKNWKNKKSDLTFIIPEYQIFYKCKIEKIQFAISERTGDIDINISLIETRQQDRITDSITGLFKRE